MRATVGAVLALLLLGITPVLAQPAPLEGDWILVTLSDAEAGLSDLYLVRPDGTSLTNLTNGVAEDSAGEVSPDGTAIAFSSTADGSSRIWLMDVTGADRVPLSPGYGTTPTWTPDGTAVVYGGAGELRMVDRDGSDDRLVAVLPDGALTGNNPDVSPDGSTVVFDVQVEADRQVYVIALAGGEITKLTTEGGFEPEWSPDGTTILFTTFRAGFGNNAWVMNPNGSDQRNLFPSEFNDFQHSWSPDGARVVFESVRNEDFAITVHDLATGTAVDVLTALGPAVYRDPSWVKVIIDPPTDEVTTTVTAPGTTTLAPSTTAPATGNDSDLDLALLGFIAALIVSAVVGALLVLRSRHTEPPPPPPAA